MLTDLIYCVVLSDNTEIWINQNQRINIMNSLSDKTSDYIKVGDEIFLKRWVVGIYTAEKMEERKHLKRGDWKCRHGKWHTRYDNINNCGCYIAPKNNYQKLDINEAGLERIQKIKETVLGKKDISRQPSEMDMDRWRLDTIRQNV